VTRLNPTTQITDAFRALASPLLREAIRRARSLDQGTDAEAFHKLRIALRRLRSLWWAYEPFLDKQDAKLQRDEFKVLADAAGKTRDWDVLRELLVKRKYTREAFSSILQPIDEYRANALSYSRAAIGNADIEQILGNALERALVQLTSIAEPPLLGEFARARIETAERKLRKRINVAVKTVHDDYATLHQVRIAGKKVRYLLEFFSPILDDSHQSAILTLASLQQELGNLNDIVTSESLIRQYEFAPATQPLVADLLRWLLHEKQLSRDQAYSHIRRL